MSDPASHEVSDEQKDSRNPYFEEFIKEKKLLIIEPSLSTMRQMSRFFELNGMPQSLMYEVDTLAEADYVLKHEKPEIFISEYDIENTTIMDLLRIHRKNWPNPTHTLVMAVTTSTSQLNVARAAEEEIDAYVIRPFGPSTFRKVLFKVVEQKVKPGNYLSKLAEGRVQLEKEAYDMAIEIFTEARALQSVPSLADYYIGYAYWLKKDLKRAEEAYLSGLSVNRLHYKCMQGLLTLLMDQNREQDAYRVARRLARYFPANPFHLAHALKLAIATESYEDIERYYYLTTKIPDKNEDLVKYIAAALTVTGRYYLKRNTRLRAMELFQKAATVCDFQAKILREIITALLDAKLERAAEDFLEQFPETAKNSNEYMALSYLLADRMQAMGPMVARGKQLINKGVDDPYVYQVVIRRLIESEEFQESQEYLETALQKWPDQAEPFKKLQEMMTRVSEALDKKSGDKKSDDQKSGASDESSNESKD